MSQAVDQPRKKVIWTGAPLIERDIVLEKSKVFVEQSKRQAEQGAKPVDELYTKTYTKADGTEEIVLFNSDKAKENKALEKEDEEDEAVDQESNEMETGVEAPENNEKPETNLKRKNAMVNGNTPKKQKQDARNTANAVQKMKVDIRQIVANIGTDNVAKNIEEMDKFIKIIIESDTPGIESVHNGLSLVWVHIRQTLQKLNK